MIFSIAMPCNTDDKCYLKHVFSVAKAAEMWFVHFPFRQVALKQPICQEVEEKRLKNTFHTVFSSVEQEKETYKQPPSEELHTRYMFYDMMLWRNRMNE